MPLIWVLRGQREVFKLPFGHFRASPKLLLKTVAAEVTATTVKLALIPIKAIDVKSIKKDIILCVAALQWSWRCRRLGCC